MDGLHFLLDTFFLINSDGIEYSTYQKFLISVCILNIFLLRSGTSKKKKSSAVIIAIVISVVVLLLISAVAIVVLCLRRRKRKFAFPLIYFTR
jgi:hypothetical protein